MKKVINGKVYDTDTALLIYSGQFGVMRQRRDFYKTTKGTFFCHYVNVGKIELVSEEYMMQLLAEYDVDKYIEVFGDIEEG